MGAVLATPTATRDIQSTAGKATKLNRNVIVEYRHTVDQTAIDIHALITTINTGDGFAVTIAGRIDIVVKADTIQIVSILIARRTMNGNGSGFDFALRQAGVVAIGELHCRIGAQ